MHRTTVWRRKRRLAEGKRRHDVRGRKLKSPAKDVTLIKLCAKWLMEAALTRQQRTTDLDNPSVAPNDAQFLNKLARSLAEGKFPAQLLAVAVFDLSPVPIRRRNHLNGLVENVARENPHAEKREIARLIRNDPQASWLASYESAYSTTTRNQKATKGQACPSRKIPNMTRRMVSYWRAHCDYQEAREFLERLGSFARWENLPKPSTAEELKRDVAAMLRL